MLYECQIIGYGNPQRRDDGIGPHVLRRLQPLFKERPHVRLRILHQLDPVLVAELEPIEHILFVDATAEVLRDGRQWSPLRAELAVNPWLPHQVTPAILLGMLQTLYHRSPSAWSVAVQGDDFGFGFRLTEAARQRARRVTDEILEFIKTGSGGFLKDS